MLVLTDRAIQNAINGGSVHEFNRCMGDNWPERRCIGVRFNQDAEP